MAGLMLALFPVLLIFDTRLAVAALALGIVLLYRKRLSVPTRVASRASDDST